MFALEKNRSFIIKGSALSQSHNFLTLKAFHCSIGIFDVRYKQLGQLNKKINQEEKKLSL